MLTWKTEFPVGIACLILGLLIPGFFGQILDLLGFAAILFSLLNFRKTKSPKAAMLITLSTGIAFLLLSWFLPLSLDANISGEIGAFGLIVLIVGIVDFFRYRKSKKSQLTPTL